MQFARLNAFGEEVGKPTDTPTSRIGQNNQKQVGILYGHNGGGKVYSYNAGDNVRVGDLVTPMVTSSKGKDYKTLGRVVSTRNSLSSAAQDTASHLAGSGIMLKTLGATNQTSLPGFKAQKAENPDFNVKQWKADAERQYKADTMKRLNPMGEET